MLFLWDEPPNVEKVHVRSGKVKFKHVLEVRKYMSKKKNYDLSMCENGENTCENEKKQFRHVQEAGRNMWKVKKYNLDMCESKENTCENRKIII